MPPLVVTLPTEAIDVDRDRYPDRDRRAPLDHLVRYCEQFDPLPAVTVVIEGSRSIVVRGHAYLDAARTLRRPRLCAVITSDPSSDAVNAFLLRSDVETLDWQRVRDDELRDPAPVGWHVFSFERALSSDERHDFDARVRALFAGLDDDVAVSYGADGLFAEFRARTPVADHAWTRRHLSVFISFCLDRVRIVSYQGMPFDVPDEEE